MTLERCLLSEQDDEVMLPLSLLVSLESLCVPRMSMGRNSESLSEWWCSESADSAENSGGSLSNGIVGLLKSPLGGAIVGGPVEQFILHCIPIFVSNTNGLQFLSGACRVFQLVVWKILTSW